MSGTLKKSHHWPGGVAIPRSAGFYVGADLLYKPCHLTGLERQPCLWVTPTDTPTSA